MTVREIHEQFKLEYLNEKIGSTSFSLLRPKHVLPMPDIPQNKNFGKLLECNEGVGGEVLSYLQWENIDLEIVKVEKSETVQDVIDMILKCQAIDFLMHSFITHVQYIYFQECKQLASEKSIISQINFSMNYRTTCQDDIQNASFNYKQVGLFNAVVYSGLCSQVTSYSLISDDASHDEYSVRFCLTKIITDLKKNDFLH
ncbi:unnamed protein product [Rotaria sp. Silwood2]|nr:unnamed protein product [Rotaria sp. Silwood2]CAF3053923.1 unnamed protein product [Rotaria sp. Silwood2]CAF3312868.1 unnamed protein product [Rotaria sp. Silwood2]CAF3393647.1 unnamed protein product [Rotaria sp. Silwood2]CAF4148431.1 unnamed protein product [Rotaria sp. Silwood2]